ncbi:MAG: PAC2 family protein, partial [Candidatus Heimdallarchaeota archaeon]
MNEENLIDKEIKLKNAVMIIGLGGWGNAGEVSTFAVKYLTEKVSAKKFGEIPSESFHSYLIQRPMVSINQGVIESYIPPRNDLFYWKTKGSVDLVLLYGYEPHLNWKKFIKTVIKIATETGVERIYTIGGYLADNWDDSEIPIAASTNNEQLLARLEEVDVELTNYKGPTSIYSELMWEAREKIDVISLWCAVPIY